MEEAREMLSDVAVEQAAATGSSSSPVREMPVPRALRTDLSDDEDEDLEDDLEIEAMLKERVQQSIANAATDLDENGLGSMDLSQAALIQRANVAMQLSKHEEEEGKTRLEVEDSLPGLQQAAETLKFSTEVDELAESNSGNKKEGISPWFVT